MACKFNGKCEHRSGQCKSDNTIFNCTYGLNGIIVDHTLEKIQLKKKIDKLQSERDFLLTLFQTAMERLGEEVNLSRLGESH